MIRRKDRASGVGLSMNMYFRRMRRTIWLKEERSASWVTGGGGNTHFRPRLSSFISFLEGIYDEMLWKKIFLSVLTCFNFLNFLRRNSFFDILLMLDCRLEKRR